MLVQTLEVYAAASLREAFSAVARRFEAGRPGVRVHLQFAGSQTLAAQIANGAPADVFASADARSLARIAYDPTTRRVFATNRLVVIGVPSLRALSGVRRIVLASPAVPAGGYARTALARAGRVYGAAWLAAVRARVVSEETDVRAVRAKVRLGEADAGIVYATDAKGAALPDAFQPRIAYPVAVPKDAPEPRLARRFVEFLVSREGRRLLARRGFGPP